jgi:hypothetical protein
MMKVIKRRQAILDRAIPTPKSRDGMYFDLRIALYTEHDKHTHISHAEMNGGFGCNNDLIAIAEFARLLEAARRRQRTKKWQKKWIEARR